MTPRPPSTATHGPTDARGPTGGTARRGHAFDAEEGSMVSEYGLVAVLGATIAGIAIAWAKGGAVTTLLAAVLRQLRAVVAG